MGDKEWTPADIGLTPVWSKGLNPEVIIGWGAPRLLNASEQMRAQERQLADYNVCRGPVEPLPAGHPYKAPRASFDHLAPDHPWRTGTVPKPVE